MFHSLANSEGWLSLITLVFMEVILGIDNIIFVSLVANRLPESLKKRGRFYGLSIAMVIRILLLFGIAVLISLTKPWFMVFSHEFSGKDLIMIAGGIFLLYQTTREIHKKIEGSEEEIHVSASSKFWKAIIQIALINLVFSVDSILTAMGMTGDVGVMMIAVILAMILMIIFSNAVSDFIHKHPTMKMLALSFLLMIAVLLVAEGLEYHIDKRYLYFAMAFSFIVEFLNLQERKRSKKKKNAAR
jgi:predicted tellurium resistance membrane protein TerC